MSNDVRNGLIIDSNGDKSWWKDGVLHREDGPAVEWVNGHKSWWVNGIKIDEPKKIAGLKNIRRCLGINREGCPDKHWVAKGSRTCQACLKRKQEIAKEKKRKSKEKKIDIEKVKEYLKNHPRPKYWLQ
jgi:hypothetical protein